MKIVYKQGDMFKHQFPQHQPYKAYTHGCNAQGVMGSGVAAQVKKLFPEAYKAYRKQYETPYGLQVGTVVDTLIGDDIVIYNAITQQHFGRDKSTVYVDYAALENCFTYINYDCMLHLPSGRMCDVVMPKIGAGLANGDWNIISEIIERTSTHYQPVVYSL